jgi:hypothetical protein
MTAKRQVRVALACVALAVPVAIVVPSASSGAAIALQDQLVGVQHQPAIPRGATQDGTVPASSHLSMRVVLAPRDPAALAGFIAATSTPSTPQFRHYLARGQFAARFGPTSEAIATVRGQLRDDGLLVTALSPSHLVLSVAGTASRFAAALHAPLERLRLAGGALGYRLGGAARLPARVARYVSGVVGIASVVRERSFAQRPTRLSPHARTSRRAGSHTSSPRLSPSSLCAPAQSALDGLPGTFTPQQEGQAYGLTTAWGHGDDGTGKTIAIEEFAPYLASDVLTYDECFQLLPPGATTDPLVHDVLVDGGTSPGSASGSDEPTLDVEEVRALAPGANVDVYEGPNNVTGPIDTLQRIASDDTAQVVSISWGICEAFSDHADETPIFEQMAAQGQTVFAASGDSGSSDCIAQSPPSGGQLTAAAVDDPASQPLVTGVGGLTVSSISPLHESVWNDCSVQHNCFGSASGGGVSTAYARPAWQVAPGTPTGSARGAHARLVPDLSVIGDPSTGMLIYYGGFYQAIGGTSMGAPLMSALSAVAAQSCSAPTFGFLNPLLYAMAASGGDFDDVVTGNNAITAQTYDAHEYLAGPGYDMASGLGSPRAATFLPALCDGPATVTATPTTPGAASLLQLSFHSGAQPYPVGATLTVTAPPGTVLPSAAASWEVSSIAGSGAPTQVSWPNEATNQPIGNVAELTLASAVDPVDLVDVDAVGTINPRAVGTGQVTVSDSVDSLVATAPLTLSAATPSAATSTVTAASGHAAIGSMGVLVTATVRDASNDAVLGAHVTASATGNGRTLLLSTTTNGSGVATFWFRDDRIETSMTSVSAGGVPVGAAHVAFTDPWRSRAPAVTPVLGRVVGAPAVVATGSGDGWVALVREADGRLVAVVPDAARLEAAELPVAIPAAASTPSLTRLGGWLYAAYRSAGGGGDLVVLRQGGGNHLHGWLAVDLTALHRAAHVGDDPRCVVAGVGAATRLSIAWVSRGHVLEDTSSQRAASLRFTTLDLTAAAALPTSATGDVAEVHYGADDAFVVTTTDGRVLMIARTQGHWNAQDLADSALLELGGGNAIAGSPTAVVSRYGFTVAVTTRNRRVDEFVGTFDNWTAETIVGGAAGSSPPAGHATLPSLTGDPVVVAKGTVTDVVVESTRGRLVELSSLGVADPWSSYDLTSLGGISRGAASGAVALPGSGLDLLAAVGGRLVVVGGGAV